jgi:hypothetical protein
MKGGHIRVKITPSGVGSQGENWLASIIFASLYVLKRPKGEKAAKWVKRGKREMKKESKKGKRKGGKSALGSCTARQ